MTDDILAELREMRTELQTIRAHTDGVPRLDRAISLLQQDVRALKDEMRVNTAMTMRLDGSHANLLDELHAIRKLIGFADRVRKLEDAQT
jgi:hypothetical protein